MHTINISFGFGNTLYEMFLKFCKVLFGIYDNIIGL